MPVMSELRNLTRVRISGPPGVRVGRIEDIRPVAEMPELPGPWPDSGEFEPHQIMRDWGVTRVAAISYDDFLFTALEIAGEWYDLKRQHLMLEVIGQYEWPKTQVD
jgi:hypothetical protein